MDYKIIYDNWIANPLLCAEGLNELKAIENDDKQIEYRFGAELAFGTAGMRGIIGYGTNMMNIYTVRRATKGLADYIIGLGKKAMKRGVAISYDTRRYSHTFAMTAAGVLIAHGIRVYMYAEPRPVPMLSYAVRQLKAVAGIMITASHNPKEYNGYKVYGEDGAQMSPEATAVVVENIKKVTDAHNIRLWSNVETFERDVRCMYYPIPFDLLRRKIKLAEPYVEKCITFEFSHFLSPQSIYPSARNLNGLYRSYYENKNK